MKSVPPSGRVARTYPAIEGESLAEALCDELFRPFDRLVRVQPQGETGRDGSGRRTPGAVRPPRFQKLSLDPLEFHSVVQEVYGAFCFGEFRPSLYKHVLRPAIVDASGRLLHLLQRGGRLHARELSRFEEVRCDYEGER